MLDPDKNYQLVLEVVGKNLMRNRTYTVSKCLSMRLFLTKGKEQCPHSGEKQQTRYVIEGTVTSTRSRPVTCVSVPRCAQENTA